MNLLQRSWLFAAFVLVELVLASSASAQVAAHLVKDIFPGTDPDAFSYPDDFVALDGMVLFTADDGLHGREPWRTDGTEAGTVLVKDINPGAGPSILYSPALQATLNRMFFFRAYDGVHGNELWRSDGTAEGTVLVKDINPGASDASPDSLFVTDGMLYFSANDGTTGTELWKSDGTDSGTVRVADIDPGAGGSSPYSFTRSGDTIFSSLTTARTDASSGAQTARKRARRS